MDIPKTLRQQIVEFLTALPNIHENKSRQALIYSAGLDATLEGQIDFSGASVPFFQTLVETLLNYGELQDERHALEAVLEAAKQQVGHDKHVLCDQLLQDFQTQSLKGVSDLLKTSTLKELQEQYPPLDAYLTTMQKRYGIMRIFGMTKPVSLDELYIHVNILDKPSIFRRLPKEQVKATFLNNRSFGQPLEERKDGLEIVRGHDYLFILGKPGSGKTTFLKYLVLQAIEGHLKCIPIFIELKEFSTSGNTLEEFIRDLFEGCGFSDTHGIIADLFTTGQVLLLCDGLDEVTQEGNVQTHIISELTTFIKKYHTNQYLITCRIAATEYVFEQFTYVEIADFDDLQIQQFVKQWFNDETKQSQFLQEFQKHQGLKELAQTPLLLGFLCMVFEELQCFPSKRSKLYEEALAIFLKKWDSSRGIARAEVYKELSLKRKQQLFAQIATESFEKGEYILEQKFIEKILATYLNQEIDEEAILKAIEAQHGILVERAKGLYSFSHLTFQEYFTARYIVEDAHKGTLRGLIQNHCTDENWHEVFLLTAEMLDDADEFFEIFLSALENMVQQEKKLQELLMKVEQEATTLQIDATLVEKRWVIMYFILICTDPFTYNNIDLNYAWALASNITDDNHFASNLAHDIVNTIEKSKQLGLADFSNILDSLSTPFQAFGYVLEIMFRKLCRLQDSELTKKQVESITHYLEATQLLITCLKNVYVSNKDGVIERLFRMPQKKKII